MSEILYLNGRLIDLKQRSVTRKLQIGDVADVSSRKSNFSYSVKIPMTTENASVLDFLGFMGNTSRKPYELIRADYIVNGVPLIVNGTAIVSRSGDDYEINIYDGVINISDRIKGKKLNELNLTDLNHVVSSPNYVRSLTNEDGYIYGVANFGKLFAVPEIKVETQAPSFFIHTLFRRIFNEAGLNIEGDFFQKQEYLDEILTPFKGYDIENIPYTETAEGGFETIEYQYLNKLISFVQVSDSQILQLQNDTFSGGDIVGDKLIFSATGIYRFDIETFYSCLNSNVTLKIYINEVPIVLFLDDLAVNRTVNKSLSLNVQAGDEVYFEIVTSSKEFEGRHRIDVTLQNTISIFSETGFYLEVKNLIDDIEQIDFVKDVLNRFGLLITEVKNSNTYVFTQIERVLSNYKNAEDWTEKIVSKISETYDSGYAKENSASYEYPEEIVSRIYDSSLSVNNVNAKAEGVLFKSPFEIAEFFIAGFFGASTFTVPIWRLNFEFNSEDINRETRHKILKVVRVSAVGMSAKFYDEVGSVAVSSLVPVLSMNGMFMGNFLQDNYTAFELMINDFKKVDFEANLSVIDIYNLNFLRLKFLKQYGRFYYLQSVTHTPNKNSKITMLEIKNFGANRPPSQVGNNSIIVRRNSTRILFPFELTENYFDPEGDAPKAVRFISGFNTDILLKNNGVVVDSQADFELSNLNLTFQETLDTNSVYFKNYQFKLSDVGSEEFSEVEGTLQVITTPIANTPPTANAGDDVNAVYDGSGQDLIVNITGGASSDLGGTLISFSWAIISSPSGSNAVLLPVVNPVNQPPNPAVEVSFPDLLVNEGTYQIELTVTDNEGASSSDIVEIFVSGSTQQNIFNLFAYYRFDNGNYNDAINSLNPTIISDVYNDLNPFNFGTNSAGFGFNASDASYLSIPHNDLLSFTTQNEIQNPDLRQDKPFSVTFWADLLDSSNHWFLSKRGAPEDKEWQVSIFQDELRVQLFDMEKEAENGLVNTLVRSISLGSNYSINNSFISVTYDPSLPLANRLNIMINLVNNSFDSSLNFYERMTSFQNQNLVIGIASWDKNAASQLDLNGNLKGIGLYNKALSIQELTTIRNIQFNGNHLI